MKEMNYLKRRKVCRDYYRACRNGRNERRKKSLKTIFRRHTDDE